MGSNQPSDPLAKQSDIAQVVMISYRTREISDENNTHLVAVGVIAASAEMGGVSGCMGMPSTFRGNASALIAWTDPFCNTQPMQSLPTVTHPEQSH